MTTVTNPLRFPGQYEDVETGTHYNYFRDYEATTGRYLESDPIGLEGGVNYYGYSRANPLVRYDWDGLAVADCHGEYGHASCDGHGKFEVTICNPNVCWAHCTKAHEQKNIRNAIARFSRSGCVGRQKGTYPGAEAMALDFGPKKHNEFIAWDECTARDVSIKCAKAALVSKTCDSECKKNMESYLKDSEDAFARRGCAGWISSFGSGA